MRHSLVALVASVSAIAFTQTASAADLPTKAPALVAPIASGWTGFYIGGELGFKSVGDNWNTTCVQLGGPFTCGSALNSVVFPGAPDSTASNRFNTTGVRYGLYLGAMYQVNDSWVAGLEGDYGFYKKSSSVAGILGCSTVACAASPFPLDLSGDSTSVKNGDDASLRLRAGYLLTPDLQLYGTGGIAFQKISATLTCNGATSPACTIGTLAQTDSKTLTGYTVGGGLEWKLQQNWLIRGEYRYSDFGTYHPSFFVNSGQLEVFADVKVRSHIATLGVAYLFPIQK